jgi:hypothetical protein
MDLRHHHPDIHVGMVLTKAAPQFCTRLQFRDLRAKFEPMRLCPHQGRMRCRLGALLLHRPRGRTGGGMAAAVPEGPARHPADVELRLEARGRRLGRQLHLQRGVDRGLHAGLHGAALRTGVPECVAQHWPRVAGRPGGRSRRRCSRTALDDWRPSALDHLRLATAPTPSVFRPGRRTGPGVFVTPTVTPSRCRLPFTGAK